MKYNITKRQKMLLEYLKSREDDPPSIREMASALNLKSTSGAYRLLERLRDRGHIQWLPGTARSVIVL